MKCAITTHLSSSKEFIFSDAAIRRYAAEDTPREADARSSLRRNPAVIRIVNCMC